MDLPVFTYHRDPILSGSIVASKDKCVCCKKVRGYVYAGPAYAEDDLEDALCPWCIADGSAHERFDATFMDSEAFDENIPEAAADEIMTRTPGFNTWQSGRWFACCDDAMTFIEPAGASDIKSKYLRVEGELMTHIVHDLGVSGGAAVKALQSLRRDEGPTAYVFQCRHCQALRAFMDGIYGIG